MSFIITGEILRIFDTLTEIEKEIDSSNVIRMYVCGVTVYDESHIGHARTIIVFDTLRRYLENQGKKVFFVQNFTDVDDKIINRAKQENIPASEISSKYISYYFEDFDRLNIDRANLHPKATEHISDMINLIKDLITKNYAYISTNGVYFSVEKFKEYGKLSKKKIDELLSGARIEIDKTKKNPLDFALWKFSNEEPKWASPWGEGRPGWHIECSAMSLKYLGENFEIHGGGRDLIFPHHENEIAQSESHTGMQFAKIWMHVGMMTINGEKMSKSLGNIKSVKFVLDHWGPNIIRLFCLSGHYSKPIDYSEDLLKENILKWRQTEICYYELMLAEGQGRVEEAQKIVLESKKEFNEGLESNFNTPLALSAFFKFVKEINRIAAEELLTQSIAKIVLPELEKMLQILGLRIPKITVEEKVMVSELIQKRNVSREHKRFEEADQIRNKILELGITLIDHKDRTLWMKQERIGIEN